MIMLGLFDRPPTGASALLLNATQFVTSCSFSTNEQGFERLTAQLSRSLTEAFRLYDKLAPIYVGLFWNGAIVWEGRLEDPTLSAGSGGSGFSLQALGYVRALTDTPYTALWSMTTVDDFVPMRSEDNANRTPEKWESDTNNRIYLAPKKNENFANGVDGMSLTFAIPHGSSRQFVGCQFDFEYKAPANWNARFDTMTEAFAGIAAQWSQGGNGAVQKGSIHITFTAADRIAFTVLNNTGGNVLKASDTGVDYLKVTNLRFVTATTNRVNTSLTANITATPGTPISAPVVTTARMYVGQRLIIAQGGGPGVSESVIVTEVTDSTHFKADFALNHLNTQAVQGHVIYADEIVKDMTGVAAALNSTQLSAGTAQIQSPGLDLTDETYEDASMLDIFTHLATLGDNATPPRRWEGGVDEGQKVFFRPQLSGRAWFVDVEDLQIERSLDELRNSEYATYSDARNRALRTSINANASSVQRYGITRRATVGADTTSAVQANIIRDTALGDTKDQKPRATVRFTALRDLAGARYPLWLAEAGDTITIRNLPPTSSVDYDRLRTFRITHTNYDVLNDTLEVEPDAPPPTLEVMLARREEGIKS